MTCSNCGRPLRPWLRGFCPRCVTTPKQRERLAISADAISKEGPLGRALDILGGVVLLLVGLAIVGALWAWLGFVAAMIALVALIVVGVLFIEGG